MIRTRPRWTVERWPLLEGVWVEPSSPDVWPLFSAEHYLPNLNFAAKCYIAVDDDGLLIGFNSAIPQPSRFGGYWREHRLVVSAGARGRGVGVALSQWLGEQALASGHRFYSRTRNTRVSAARDASPLWRRVDHTERKDRQHMPIELQYHRSVGHEYIGRCNTSRRLQCQHCGRLFAARRAHAKYCDVTCRVAAHRAS